MPDHNKQSENIKKTAKFNQTIITTSVENVEAFQKECQRTSASLLQTLYLFWLKAVFPCNVIWSYFDSV